MTAGKMMISRTIDADCRNFGGATAMSLPFRRAVPFSKRTSPFGVRRRRTVKFIPWAELFENRQLLSVTFQSSELSATVSTLTDSQSYPDHLVTQDASHIGPLSDEASGSAGDLTAGSSGSYVISLNSSVSADSGTVHIEGSLSGTDAGFLNAYVGALYTTKVTADYDGTLVINYDNSPPTDPQTQYNRAATYLSDGQVFYYNSGTYSLAMKKGTSFEFSVHMYGQYSSNSDTVFDYEQSSAVSWQVTPSQPKPQATTIVVKSAPNPSTYGQPVTFTATVSPATSSQFSPTGAVTFMDGSTAIGSGTLNASDVATFTSTDSQLAVGTHPITAVYVGDSNFSSSTSSPITQMVSSPPSVSLTYFDWFGASSTIDYQTPNLEMYRGINFRYKVSGTIPSSLIIPIAFYWASTADAVAVKTDIIEAAQAYNDDESDEFIINTSPGSHGYLTGESFVAGNDPARWGVPPENAKFVMAIIDPDNLLGATDYTGRVKFLALPSSVGDVLSGSIQKPDVNGPNIDATFKPGLGSGQQMPLSEAEVYLGVDHFNWIQTVTSIPNTWVPITLAGLNKARLYASFESHKPGLVFVDGNVYYYNADGTIDFSSPITYTDDSESTWYDPVVQSEAGAPDYYTKAIIINGVNVDPFLIDTDQYVYYYDEASLDDGMPVYKDLGLMTFAYDLSFHDAPRIPAYLSPYPSGIYESFQTQLVGVGYDSSNTIRYSENGYPVVFTWKSNTTVNPRSGGVILTKNEQHINTPNVVSGGIKDVTVGDLGHYVPDVPIEIDKVASRTLYRDQTLSVAIYARSLYANMKLSYKIMGEPPAGASIDGKTGQFTFTPKSTGVFLITVGVTDQNGRATSTTFTITVISPAPPSNPPSPVEPSSPSAPGGSTPNVSIPKPAPSSSGYGPVPDAFVTTLYREVLNRLPEPAGLQYWSGKLVARVRPFRLVRAVFRSPERRVLDVLHTPPRLGLRRVLADATRAARQARKA
ncbi:Ig-like domain repeat protein [Singulisphaera sp. PoT]|uniref:Ig-like domain repeat protein n=1 Tax=Singulisphaera sp. PoT TaxID=3411797 RepID=UPI003BF5D44F